MSDWRRSLRIFSFGLTLLSLFFVGAFSLLTVSGQALDQLVLDHLTLSFPATRAWAWPVVRSISLVGFSIFTVGVVLLAVWRRRWELGLRLVILVTGANVTTQVLKNFVLGRPYVGVGFQLPNSLPSGHVTVACCAALALVAVASQRFKVWAALVGTAFAGLVSLSVIFLGWHRPSDVTAAILISFLWALVLIPQEAPQGYSQRLNKWLLGGFGLSLLGFLGGVILAWPLLRNLVDSSLAYPRAPGMTTPAGTPLAVFTTQGMLAGLYTLCSLLAVVALLGFVLQFVVFLESGRQNKH